MTHRIHLNRSISKAQRIAKLTGNTFFYWAFATIGSMVIVKLITGHALWIFLPITIGIAAYFILLKWQHRKPDGYLESRIRYQRDHGIWYRDRDKFNNAQLNQQKEGQ